MTDDRRLVLARFIRGQANLTDGHPHKPGPGEVKLNHEEALIAAEALERPDSSSGERWLPIESAPKDGSNILVCYKHVETWCFFNAFWLEGDETDEPEQTGWWSYTHSEVSREKLCGIYSPTHWKPLSTPEGRS